MSDDSDYLEMHSTISRQLAGHANSPSIVNTDNSTSLRPATSVLFDPDYFDPVSPLELSPSPLSNSSSDSLPQLILTTNNRRGAPAASRTQRERGLSRSFSVPNMSRLPMEQEQSGNDGGANQENLAATTATARDTTTATRHSTSSVKHLTCFWWKDKGSCRYSDENCLYAHWDTGHYTDPPRQLIPGEPALAGRRLERALHNLNLATHRSSASLYNMSGTRRASRPATPGLELSHRPSSTISFSSPLTSPPHYDADNEIARLNSDNQFLRTLVDQSGKEKAIMVCTIESLQTDNKAIRGELEGLRKAQEQLLVERQGLHSRIQQLEDEQAQNFSTGRNIRNPFGTIGRGRVNTETRYLGGLLTED